ncbi:MAG: Gfo/Idh/MocA family oxidoreductase [Armatimonadetes bacterium]|nr:Gfo/Idh/MocA family oxidoreductase [Armatimonadota bacterium]
MKAPIGCAVIGYGPLHNFGWAHSAWIEATPELSLLAVCDLDPARTAAAKEAFPHIRTYNDVAEVWADGEVELVSIVTPHFTHCPLAVQAFAAGKHVVVEKAMCLSVAEATQMIEAGKRARRTLAVHHNRRHDGNFRRIREIVGSGAIGEVFEIELYAGGYGPFRHGWYSEKAKSGGAFYFWGPHAVDWVLALIPERIVGVNGYFHNRVWHEITNEDQVRATIRFANGCAADVTWSHIAAIGKPLWRILGTKGGILDTGANAIPGYEKGIRGPVGGSLTLVTYEGGERKEEQVPYLESDWDTYWQGVADHLLRGGPVPVSGEAGRRTIGVFEAAERSSQTGQTEQVPYE